ncbi:MAG: DUF4065 domain-containing protein [Tannerellaceae bacterium]|nr:DUF4065 domain-containing protein [Tannerellaceae bacterium]
MAYNVFDIANKILAKPYSSDTEELVSNLKLQKLLYYEQGFHLAYYGTPLFDDDIEAWMNGPVVPVILETFKCYKNGGIEYSGDTITLTLNKEEQLFNEVYTVYGKYSATGLMDLAYQEMPWSTTKTGVGSIIPREKMIEYFKGRLKRE